MPKTARHDAQAVVRVCCPYCQFPVDPVDQVSSLYFRRTATAETCPASTTCSLCPERGIFVVLCIVADRALPFCRCCSKPKRLVPLTSVGTPPFSSSVVKSESERGRVFLFFVMQTEFMSLAFGQDQMCLKFCNQSCVVYRSLTCISGVLWKA